MANTLDSSAIRGRNPNSRRVIPITGTHTVSTSDALFGILEFTGDIATAFDILLPPVDGHEWVCVNSCTGAGTMTVKTSAPGSTGIVVGQGSPTLVYTDGLNVTAIGGGGTFTAQEAKDAGLMPAAPIPSSSIGANWFDGVTYLKTVASETAFTLTDDIATYGARVVFIQANQAFTATFPGTGPWYHWLVWNKTDYLATCKTTVGSEAGVVIPPQSHAIIAYTANPDTTFAKLEIYGIYPLGAGATSVTVVNGVSDTLTDAEAANTFINLTGANQETRILWPSGSAIPGRTWIVENNTAYTMRMGGALGPTIPAGRTGQVVIDYAGNFDLLGPTWSGGNGFAPTAGQIIIGLSTGKTLSLTEVSYSNIEFQDAGLSGGWKCYWPTLPAAFAGQEWVVANTTGQTAALEYTGGVSDIFLQNNERKKIYWDGSELREVRHSAATEIVRALGAGTTTYTAWDEIDADYLEFTPSAGNATVQWPNGSALYKRGRKQTIKCDHATSALTVLTTGASAAKTTVLAPGETRSFVIDDAGSIVPESTFDYKRRVAISFPSDANFTVLTPDFLAQIIEVSGSISVTRDLIMPLVDCHEWLIVNGTAQSIRVIGASGAGVTIATGKAARVYCTGTDYKRATPDA